MWRSLGNTSAATLASPVTTKRLRAWRKSQHHDAMARASEQSVLGNFNNAKFAYAGSIPPSLSAMESFSSTPTVVTASSPTMK